MMAHKYTALHHILTHATNILVVAHSRPDPDTIGATTALFHYLAEHEKSVTLTCADPFPQGFDDFLPPYTLTPTQDVNFDAFDVIIGADNIDRGFHSIINTINPHNHVTVGIDHHPHTTLHPDVLITNPAASSTCEILYEFFTHINHTPSKEEASALAIGILGDTRIFHNPNTSAHTLDITAALVDAHAPLTRIIKQAFLTKRLATLHIWGSALKSARRLTPSGAIVSVITHDIIRDKNIPEEELKEELKEVASLLCSVPHTPFALVLIQIDEHTIKGSLRAEKSTHTDTAAIAQLLGGGGHRLASGFEIRGTLRSNGDTWQVV